MLGLVRRMCGGNNDGEGEVGMQVYMLSVTSSLELLGRKESREWKLFTYVRSGNFRGISTLYGGR